MSIASSIAWRYLRFKHKDKNISFMIKVCFLGIFIGTFALMLTLIITNGFEKVVHEKMQGINAQIIVSAPGNRLNYQEIRELLLQEHASMFKGVSGYSLKQAILNQDDAQHVIVLKGIDPEHETEVTNIDTKVILPSSFEMQLRSSSGRAGETLAPLLEDNGIIIGYKTAQLHGLSVGDDITLMIPEPGGKKSILLNKKKFTIKGVFNVGLEEYDSNFAFISLDLMHELYDEEGVDYLTLTINEENVKKSHVGFDKVKRYMKSLWDADAIEHEVLSTLKDRLPNLQVQSWKELYPALVSSLKLEKYVMFLIIVLISLVASMNMISLLFMQIQQKQRDVAIFKAMGLAGSSIRNIFLYLGMTVTLLASLMGLGCAALIGHMLEKYPCIELPDVYYVSHLPARMDWDIFLIVFVVTLLIGFIATWFPAQRSKHIAVAEVLRQG